MERATDKLETPMTQTKLVQGNMHNIITMLLDADAELSIRDSGYGEIVELTVGNAPKSEALRAEHDKRSKDMYTNDTQRSLIQMQIQQRGAGFRPLRVGDNIYGWAVGSLMLSNMGGGRWSISGRHGLSLEQAIAFGIKQCERSETTFTIRLCSLDKDGKTRYTVKNDASTQLQELHEQWLVAERRRQTCKRLAAECFAD